ncbi:MAG: DNA polymerase I [Bacteroidetes bacterium GWF2_49_14]|nr:MAG: DNA polymerase I [Bacteroidetes bacterium GWF2_49_14]HBB90917.1 DNA polymerase I [Bacteroidales bacterium]
MQDSRLFLLDAYALIYRSYYAFIKNPRINSKGLNTSAAFGFTLTLEELLRKEDPTHIAVVFDPPGPTFRNDMFAAYKAQRPPMPEDLRACVPYIKKIIDAFRIPVLEVSGYEADDVIGTLAKKAEKQGYSVFMMTPDKDYTQLVDDRINILKPRRSGNDVEMLGPEEVCRDFGIDRPAQVIDILALWGDSADNIPGAPGIGEKTAKELIKRYGSVDGVYEHIDELKGKQKESLIANREQVMLARDLVTICLTVPIEFDADILLRKKPDERLLRTIFEELEFRTLLSKVMQQQAPADLFASPPPAPRQESLFESAGEIPAGGPAISIQSNEHTYHLVTGIEEIQTLASAFSQKSSFCFDTETTGLNAIRAEIVGLALSHTPGEAWYIHFPDDRQATLNLLQPFKAVFENPSISKTGQNIKYDLQVLASYGIRINGPLFDTMLAHYLINPDERHNLNFLADKYLDYKMVPIEQLIGEKGKDQRTMRSVAPELQKEYAGEDADMTNRLRPILQAELDKNGLTPLFTEIEMPLVPVLAGMERAGIRLDKITLADISLGLSEEIEALEKEIISIAGMTFNVASPKQLGEVLFDHLKIDPQARKTKSGQYSTSEDVLARLAYKHPIIDKILEFRGLTKLLNTYIDTLPDLVDPVSSKIHTHFNQAIAATGRLSSINPNMQNIPIREERGREIRRAFVASDQEHTILSADYSQIELRIMAHMSGDENMIAAFNRSEDIHTATAALINRVKPEQVTREMRSRAKVANFGIIYGISSFGLSQRLNISRSDAKELIDGYFRSYPGIRLYMDQSIRQARDQGYVTTIMGRRRYLADILSENQVVRGVAERNAINSPIQGSAADIIKIAMIRIHRKIESLNLKSRMVLQVHDELNFDVYLPELRRVKEIVRHEMEHAIQLKVPLLVDVGEGRNWLEAHG